MQSNVELAVDVRGLRKSYGAHAAVDGIDLAVRRGEVFALLGPNGAGKTTTVEVLEGYRARDGGDVTVLGHDPGHPDRTWRTRIGIVLQTGRDAAEVTVEEMVRHFATFYPDARRVDEVIDTVGLADRRRTRTRALSGGQRRRLDVALGILGHPELLFLDEPTTGFDPEARRSFWTLIERLAGEGTTILLTTHYLEEAEHLADRVGVMARGRVVAVDTPERLGGRDSAEALVRWTEDGSAREVRTASPTATVSALHERLGAEAADLSVSRPTLEDVYLRLTEEPA